MSTRDRRSTALSGTVGAFQEAVRGKRFFIVELEGGVWGWPGRNRGRGGALWVEGTARVQSRGETGLGELKDV